jgi:hypothetical protein
MRRPWPTGGCRAKRNKEEEESVSDVQMHVMFRQEFSMTTVDTQIAPYTTKQGMFTVQTS